MELAFPPIADARHEAYLTKSFPRQPLHGLVSADTITKLHKRSTRRNPSVHFSCSATETPNVNSRLMTFVLAIVVYGQAMVPRTHAELVGNISVGTKANNFNMTTMNGEVPSVIDWVVWGQGQGTSLSPSNSRVSGTAISDLTLYNPASQPLRGLGQFSLGESFQWTDGSPTASASSVRTGLQVNSELTFGADPNLLLGTGFSFTVAGSPSLTQRLYVWVGQHSGVSDFTATLNGFAPVTYQLSAPTDGNSYALLTYDFSPNLAGDLLTVTGTVSTVSPGSTGIFTNNYWFGAAVGSVGSSSVPEIDPATGSSALSLVVGVLAMIEQRRRRITIMA